MKPRATNPLQLSLVAVGLPTDPPKPVPGASVYTIASQHSYNRSNCSNLRGIFTSFLMTYAT
jgi:hypothetical protein